MTFLRASGSDVHRRLRTDLANRAPLATTEVIVLELLAGAKNASHLEGLRRLLMGCRLLSLRGLAEYEEAASLYRSCRTQGVTVRRLTECLIATVAIRSGVPMLHADRDFDLIAGCSPLLLIEPA